MPGPFDVTAVSNTVRLDDQRQGEASFTVFNSSERTIRAFARLVPENPASEEWLTLEGDAGRDFGIASTFQYTVKIAVPPEAPAGDYPFRLDMLGEERPDIEFTEGPTVTFEVRELPIEVPVEVKEPFRLPFPWWYIAAGVGGLVVIAGIVVAVVLLLSGPGMVKVPSVAKLTVEAAGATLTAADLKVGLQSKESSRSVPADLVIRSNPDTGAEVEKGSDVALVVSSGPRTVTIPATIIGMDAKDAALALEQLCNEPSPCVDVEFDLEFHPTVERDFVIGSGPLGGEEVEPGSTVTLLLSAGPEPPLTVRVPTVVGQTVNNAEATLTKSGLRFGRQSLERSRSVELGRVIRSSPATNTVVEIGSSVALVVSTGPQTVTLPKVAGLTSSAAKAELEALCSPRPCLKVSTQFQRLPTVVPMRFLDAVPNTILERAPIRDITDFSIIFLRDAVLFTDPDFGSTVKAGSEVVLHVIR